MKKKNLFNVKYASVYLMLNALMLKSYDYKSIALPAELQGHLKMILYNNISNNQFKFLMIYSYDS